MSLLSELRRRNVFRMAALYLVSAWLIMQVAEVVMTLAVLPDWTGRVLLALLALGFPVALIFSWFYELTPEGLSLEKDVERADSIMHITGRRMDFIVISLLVAVVLLFAWHTWWQSVPANRSIAVLAFENISGDPGQEYLCDGISEELLNDLAKIPELRVIARTSSFSFKGKNTAIPEIAKQLNVGHVVEGSVRKMGNRVRITAQLIDASNNSHSWSETYDRELEDLFALQDEISTAIVEALRDHLGLQATVAPNVIVTAISKAHDAYLRGRYLLTQRTKATTFGAIREFERAVELDPDYALAHAELAIAHLLSSRTQYGDELTVAEVIARALPHVERAMALDPNLAEAHAAAGFLVSAQRNREKATAHFERAIQINPNYSLAYDWLADVLYGKGQYVESFAVLEKAAHLDPLSIATQTDYIAALIERNRVDDANGVCENLIPVYPIGSAVCRHSLTSFDGNWANGILASLDHLQIDPESNSARRRLSLYFAMLGLEKEALSIRQHTDRFALSMLGEPDAAVEAGDARFADEPKPVGQPRMSLGLALAGAGDYKRARPFLEERWQERGRTVTSFGLFGHYNAVALVAIRRDAGEEAGAAELLAALRDNVRRYRKIGTVRAFSFHYNVDFEEGIADFLDGKRNKGLALIAKAVEDGYFILPDAAYLRVLYDDPGFATIRASQEARQAHEREKFLDAVCIDNPYEAVWLPAEGTCDRFVAERVE